MHDETNEEVFESFFRFWAEHPGQRFWQTVRNWSGHKFVLVADDIKMTNKEDYVGIQDTFYMSGKEE